MQINKSFDKSVMSASALRRLNIVGVRSTLTVAMLLAGASTVSSSGIARVLNLDPSQVRKDIEARGMIGKPFQGIRAVRGQLDVKTLPRQPGQQGLLVGLLVLDHEDGGRTRTRPRRSWHRGGADRLARRGGRRRRPPLLLRQQQRAQRLRLRCHALRGPLGGLAKWCHRRHGQPRAEPDASLQHADIPYRAITAVPPDTWDGTGRK